MLAVISTIAQHPLGSNVHFRNLSWAVSDIHAQVLIQTFCEYNFRHEDFNFRNEKSHLGDVNNYFRFYNEIEPFLRRLIRDGAKVFCFTQQDILFHKKIGDLYDLCLKSDKIVCSFNTPFQYTFFGSDYHRNKISHLEFDDWEHFEFPRIWEGCCFIPSSKIEHLLDEGIKFGHHPQRFRSNGDLFKKHLGLLKEKKLSVRSNKVMRVSDYILSWEANKGNLKKFGHDTFFEVALFCFVNQMPFHIDSEAAFDWLGFHISNHAVHFHFIEKVYRETKGAIYRNPDLLFGRGDIFPSEADVAFMLLMSGASSDMGLIHRCGMGSIVQVKKKAALLGETCGFWMSDNQASIIDSLLVL